MSRLGSLVAVGRTSDVYEFGRGAVVKVPRPDVPRHWADEEARFTVAVRELGAPAPEVLEMVTVGGRDAIVFERIYGKSMWEMILENPTSASAWGRELAEIHRRILCAGLPTVLIGVFERMLAKIESLERLSDGERQDALRMLAALPRGAALLHGDLHPGNVLMGPAGPIVIDWFDAAVGHPVADVARSSLLLRPLEGIAEKPHLPGASPLLLSELHDSYVSAIRDVLDRPVEELRRWEAVVTASRLAEDAETDDSRLLTVWRELRAGSHSPLAGDTSGDQRPE